MHRISFRASGVFASIILASALCPGSAGAAQLDYYIKIPPIEGDSGEKSQSRQIEIQSFSWGATQTGYSGGGGAGKVSMGGADGGNAAASGGVTVASGDVDGDGRAAATGQATGKRQHKPFVFTKPADKGSVVLRIKTATATRGLCTPGRAIGDVTIGGGGTIYELRGVTVAGCTPPASASGAAPTESISLNYEKISSR